MNVELEVNNIYNILKLVINFKLEFWRIEGVLKCGYEDGYF